MEWTNILDVWRLLGFGVEGVCLPGFLSGDSGPFADHANRVYVFAAETCAHWMCSTGAVIVLFQSLGRCMISLYNHYEAPIRLFLPM